MTQKNDDGLSSHFALALLSAFAGIIRYLRFDIFLYTNYISLVTLLCNKEKCHFLTHLPQLKNR